MLLATVFVGAAGMKLAASEFETMNFARFGYAPWFMYLAGLAEMLGAVLLWVRGHVAYGALLLAVLAVLMAGGAVSHLRVGDPVMLAAPALGLMALLCGIAVAHRHELPSPRRRTRAEDSDTFEAQASCFGRTHADRAITAARKAP
nr:DoxX family protein [Methylorubrum zatmanii]